MIRAYEDEVYAARCSVSSHQLTGGRIRAAGQSHVILEFPDPDLDEVQDGDEVQLTLSGRTHREVEVLTARRSLLVLSLKAAPPERWGGAATVLIDDTALPKAVRQRLATLADDPGAFDGRHADRLLTSPAHLPDRIVNHDGLNEQQSAAAVSASCPGATYLWGPPGTGKTTTLARIVAEHVRAGRRVLITSHTNAAVDLLLERTAWALEQDGRIEPGLLVRSGRCTPELREAYDGVLTPEGALREMGFGEEYGMLLDLERALDRAKRARAALDRRGLDAEVTGWDQRIAQLEDLRKRMEERIGDLERGVLAEARVVATTAHRAAVGRIETAVDVVVIDEASMVPIPLAWLVLGLGRSHATIAGDFRQLAPIVQAETRVAVQYLGKSLFDYAGTVRAVEERQNPEGLVALRQQHRMTPSIGDLIGRTFYPEVGLQTSPSVEWRPACPALPGLPALAGLDLQHTRSFIGRGGSRFNPMSAQIVAGLLDYARRENPDVGRDDLLLLSPYRLQSRLLHKAAEDVLGGDEPLASTVHRAQGDEARTVVFDATYSHYKHAVPRWFQGEGLGSDTSRLTNVALSRAQDQIVLLADTARLVRQMPRQPPRAAFEEVLGSGALTTSVLLDKLVGDAFDWFPRGAADQILAECQSAQESIDVRVASFRDADRSGLLDLAYLAQERGLTLRVGIGLESPHAAEWWDVDDFAHHSLRPRGALVDLRCPTWENVVVVDGRTLWASARSPFVAGSPVYRTVGPGLAREVLKASGFARPENLTARPPRGRQTDDCPRCGHGRVAVDEWHVGRGAWRVMLRCIACRELRVV
jgi:hypothetical protein